MIPLFALFVLLFLSLSIQAAHSAPLEGPYFDPATEVFVCKQNAGVSVAHKCADQEVVALREAASAAGGRYVTAIVKVPRAIDAQGLALISSQALRAKAEKQRFDCVLGIIAQPIDSWTHRKVIVTAVGFGDEEQCIALRSTVVVQ